MSWPSRSHIGCSRTGSCLLVATLPAQRLGTAVHVVANSLLPKMRAALLAGALLLAVVSTALAQEGGSLDESEGPSRPTYPVGQYAVAVLFGGVAVWSVLRSSRRGWS